MRTVVILLFLAGIIIISGCINPISEVPIVKVNITFVEKDGQIQPDPNFTVEQGTVNYLQRPRMTQAKFPAIGARTTLMKGKNSTIGPWEMTPFNGSGTYKFNIGFDEKHYPQANDTVHVSIYLTDINKNTRKGETVGFVSKNIIWK